MRDVTHGFWRKVILLPFSVKFEGAGVDMMLTEKLKAELSGILNWALEGVLLWQNEGLKPPTRCIDQKAAWQADNDPLFDFIATCPKDAKLEVKSNDLYEAYTAFCATNGLTAITSNSFSPLVQAHGFTKEKRRNGRFFVGIGVNQ